MPNVNSPAKLLKLWTKLVKKQEKGKDPKELPRKGVELKTRIRKDLTALKLQAVLKLPDEVDVASDAGKKKFEKTRDRACTKLKKYCRYLKGSNEEDKQGLPLFLKKVKQFTVVVQALSVDNLDLSPDEEIDLDNLDDIATDGLDADLEKPDTEPDSDDDEAPPDLVEGKPAPGEQPPLQTTRLELVKRAAKLGLEAQRLDSKNPFAERIQKTRAKTQELIDGGNLVQAAKALDLLEDLIEQAKKPTPSPTSAPTGQVELTKRLNELTRLIQMAEEEKDPSLAQIQKLAAGAKELIDKKQFDQAGRVLTQLEGLTRKFGEPDFKRHKKEREVVRNLITSALTRHAGPTKNALEDILAQADKVDVKTVPDNLQGDLTQRIAEVRKRVALLQRLLGGMETSCQEAVEKLR